MDIYRQAPLANTQPNPIAINARIGRLSPLALAIMLSCLGYSFSAQASCIETAPPSTPSPCTGTNGLSGGNGGNGQSNLANVTIIADITGGNGGYGSSGSLAGIGGSGGDGGDGGFGVSARGTIDINNGISIIGGNGGNGGNGDSGGYGGNGGNGGSGGYGIYATGNSTITNSGQISGGLGGSRGSRGSGGISGADGNGGAGIHAANTSIIHNHGTISGGSHGNGNGRANAITFGGSLNELWLYNGSVITGNVVAEAGGMDKLVLAGNIDSSFSLASIGQNAQYRNFAQFEKVGSSTWTLGDEGTVMTHWNVLAGTLRINNPNSTTWINTLVQNGATLQLVAGSTHNGNSQLSSGATLRLEGGQTSTANFRGNLTLDAGSILRIATSGNSAGNYDQFAVIGTATVNGKAFVDVAQVNTLAIGQTLADVLRAGTLVGDFSSVEDNSALFDFQSVVNGNALDLKVISTQSVASTLTSSSQGQDAAQVFDQLINQSNAYPDMQPVITALGQLPSTQQVANAIDQTLPLLGGSTHIALNSALGDVSSAVQARSGLASGDQLQLTGGEIWIKPFGSHSSQHKRDGAAGFTANSQGLMLGADAQLSEQSRAGLAFAYAKIDVNGRSKIAPNSSDIDLYQLIGYGNYALSETSQLDWQVDYGQARTKGQRQILFMGSTAKSNYDSQIAHAGLGFSQRYTLTESTTLTPRISADYTWIKDESYREKNAGALNLQVKRRDTESLILGVETELSHAFTERTQASLTLGVGYDAINDRTSMTSAYAGAPGLSFTTPGLKSDPWLGKVGSALSYQVSDSSEISLHYDAELRQSFSNQSAALQARWAF